MRSRPGRVRALAAAATLASITCAFPTDQSASMFVAIESASPVLLRGDVGQLRARVWLRRGADSAEVPNAELLWHTSDPLLATVESRPNGTGRVTGVNPGYVEIRAVAPAFEGATSGSYVLRVANPLEIDSISPDTVRYGDRIVVHGIGVGSLFFAGLGNGFLSIDSLAVAGDPRGYGSRAFWVTYPASSGLFFAAGSGQLVTAPEATVVLPWDRYEPNEASPAVIALDGPDQYPAVPALRFYNPGLLFEDLQDFPYGFDWYRYTTADPAQPYTFLFVAPSQGGAHITYLTDSLRPDTVSSTVAWRLGPGRYDCKGQQFRPFNSRSDTVMVALGRLPAGSVDFVSAYLQEGVYVKAVIRGYEVADKRIGPDRFEENDLCDFADENFADPARRIDLSSAFADTLTIDNPYEIDWLRIHVPGLVAQNVVIRVHPRPFSSTERSNIDLYLLRVPGANNGLDEVARDDALGSNGQISVLVSPGDYYLAVVDRMGLPVRYGICAAIGTSCSFVAGSSAGAEEP